MVVVVMVVVMALVVGVAVEMVVLVASGWWSSCPHKNITKR